MSECVTSVLIFGIISCFWSCEDQKSMNSWSASEIQLEAQSMLTRYLEDINTKGLESEFDWLDDSDQFFWVPPGFSSRLDYDSVRTILLTNAPNMKTIRNEWKTLIVNPLSGQHCAYTGEIYSFTITQSNDTTIVDMLETGVLVKRPDGWKILCGQSGIKD